MSDLTHLDSEGRARMVDVGSKKPTARRAVAEGVVVMSRPTADAFFGGRLAKGDALAVARLAGIMGAKKTGDLVPLCHPIGLDSVTVDIEEHPDGARIVATATVTAKTGVEMEAMTAVSIAALTVYDMVKGVERGVTIKGIGLLEKSGGASGEWRR